MAIDADLDAWLPQLAVTTNVAVYVPAGTKSCWTDAPVFVMPSLKYQSKGIGEQPTEPVLPASLTISTSERNRRTASHNHNRQRTAAEQRCSYPAPPVPTPLAPRRTGRPAAAAPAGARGMRPRPRSS